MLKNRSSDLEIMDDLHISGEVIGQTLRELDFINKWLGGNQISLNAFKRILNKEIMLVADLGCGSGDILIRMSKISAKKGINCSFMGIDANPYIVDYARAHTREVGNISIDPINLFSDEFRQKKFSVIHCCLFLHHFDTDTLTSLFKQFKTQADYIIVNDLHRHPVAYFLIKWLTRFFSKSYMVVNDAPLSVARGFNRKELTDILNNAGINRYTLRWKWAFRWQLVCLTKN